MLLSLETLNRALGFSEYAELVLVLPTNIMTLSRDGEPISPELDWRRPSSVSIPNQESIRWGLLIGNGRITDKIGFSVQGCCWKCKLCGSRGVAAEQWKRD
ncbi:uncharacterized protein LOC104882456 isoform X1 [Vitis vinifera]|uniref:uncharacterized protein LOC104882456 isoform X1 n=1 Tax=Vitis vinifera TaxID=29760 RepID=UPI0028832DAA|nr:uncharacterized protein LOC104882456 isoform X1 [Vitis vinifera]